MDTETLTREMLKDFFKDRRNGLGNPRPGACPFYDYVAGHHYHECCMLLFKGWAKKIVITKDNHVKNGCPCFLMSTKYVVRKTREFYAKGR